MNSIFTWERRDYRKQEDYFWYKLSLIIFIGLVAGLIFLLTPTAKAMKDINYQDVHSLDAACSFASLYPEKVSNLQELKKHCA